jgi:hypothetical protein
MDAYLPYLEQLAFSAFIIVALSDPMARGVPLLVVAPDNTYAAKPIMKERASATPRRWPNESLWNTSAVLSDEALTVWERLADSEPVLGDVVLADVRVVLARACLQNTGSALDLRLARQVLKKDDVVRKV